MLVLARKPNQSIMINDNIEIIIIEIKRDQVKVGINAPREIKVHRKEVYEEIQRENIEAARAEPDQIGKISELLGKDKKKKPGKDK